MFTKQIPMVRRVLLIVSAFLFALMFSFGQAGAETIEELQQQSAQLQEEIDGNEKKVQALGDKIDTLEGKVAQLRAEVAQASTEVELTKVKLAELKQQLEKAEVELELQKDLLRSALRALYERRGASTVELLIASDSFSDFIDEQEYLERLQGSIKDSAEQVIDLKKEIESQQSEQKSLLEEQEQQKKLVAAKRQEEQTILNETKGEEGAYKKLVARQLEELEEAEQALAAALSSGSFKTAPVGPVSGGDIIGAVGNTGLSSGAHLHLEVRVGGSVTNPGPYIAHQPVNPVYISQGYGNPDPIYRSGYHPGVDYLPGNGAIYAIESGYLYRGCSNEMLGTSYNPYGYVAIVQHSDGHVSVYAHMAGGPAACDYNTYY